jgi:UDP-3-O-[3-hydroxymyristoyl] N-acetylglucosamine deacetylase/3-hydroxyacyl-[acyl-carrier-protein] dehydratase
MSTLQQTVKAPITISGIGLHTGEQVTVIINPAPENHGYVFQRTDLEGQPTIKGLVDFVSTTERGTTLTQNDAVVHTTEHLLAALYSLEIDNALIQIDGSEIPIMDGSSKLFLEAIEAVGIETQTAQAKYFTLEENIAYEDTEKGVEMLGVPTPGGEYRITVMVDYKSPVLGTQHASMYKLEDFKKEISNCRTFCFLREVEYLAEKGLIKGGDLSNAIVLVERAEVSDEELDRLAKLTGKDKLSVNFDGIGVLNSSKLQFENEPARHKLLDIVGDLALLGVRFKGHILAARPGHAGNTSFCKMLRERMLETEKKNATPTFDPNADAILDINDITKMLPHRYPFLLVDKITSITENGITGVKNVTFNEGFFQGHFPDNPIMPGVLQVEAMAQCGGIFALKQVEDPENYSTYFMKIDNVRFKQKVLPGDTIFFDLKLLSPIRRGIVHMEGKAYVRNKLVGQAEMMAQIIKDKA